MILRNLAVRFTVWGGGVLLISVFYQITRNLYRRVNGRYGPRVSAGRAYIDTHVYVALLSDSRRRKHGTEHFSKSS